MGCADFNAGTASTGWEHMSYDIFYHIKSSSPDEHKSQSKCMDLRGLVELLHLALLAFSEPGSF